MHLDYVLFVVAYITVHGTVIVSVFDVYFSSPLVENVASLNWTNNPSAQRLVLFVADGLRADKFYEVDEKNVSRTPFLRNIILEKGTWGVSRTRAPTESRPAHVAMLGGFYEDPSGLRHLWKDNLVEFDTVLNESRETWAWGADDVIPFFNKGTAKSHVHIFPHHYPVHSNLKDLDVWVFDRVKLFLKNAKSDNELKNRLLIKDRVIFFLHLAGIDSNGHAYHPGSNMYLENIAVVDKGVEEMVQAFDEFYENDGKTAFLFTGDHGMTDEGGHGGDHPTELLSPFIAWGSGVRAPSVHLNTLTSSMEDETKKWGLDPYKRTDVSQIDVSVLMASLIGTPYPTNSLGSLPLPYISGDDASKAEKIFGRAMQIYETFLAKRFHVMNKEFYFLFWEYYKDEENVAREKIEAISKCLEDKDYTQAVDQSIELFDFSLKGLRYYQAYHKYSIQFCMTISVLGWMVLCIVFILTDSVSMHSHVNYRKIAFKGGLLSLVLCIILLVRLYSFQSPISFYFYTTMPVFTCFFLYTQIERVNHSLFRLRQVSSWKILLICIIFTACVEIVIYGFYNRDAFAFFAILLCFIPALTQKSMHCFKILLWVSLCILIMFFPMLSELVKKSTNRGLVLFGGVLATILCICLLVFHSINESRIKPYLFSYFIPLMPSIIGILCYIFSYSSLYIGKFIIILAWIVPFFTSFGALDRLLSITVWQLSGYIIVSQSYDAVFYVVLTALLHAWVVLEVECSRHNQSRPSKGVLLPSNHIGSGDSKKEHGFLVEHLRHGIILLFFLPLGFFGIFSIESMNHFRPRVLPFLPVTNNVTLILLFIYKLCLHYLAIGVAVCSVAELTNLSLKKMWIITAFFSDFIVLHFYFWIKDSGSWAEIGFSLTRFLIAAGFPIGFLLVLLIGKILMFCKIPQALRFSHIFSFSSK